MTLAEHQCDHQQCLHMAARLLDAPARALELDWQMEHILRRHAGLELRRGFDSQHAVVRFQAGRRGHELAWGLARYCLRAGNEQIRLVRVAAPHDFHATEAMYEFWAVAAHQYTRLYRFLRREARRRQGDAAPVMRERDRVQLWDNTVGFLRRGCEVLARYGVPQKRGVLLLGEPGNGKTMACRWLRSECRRYGLEWRSVSAEEFEEARSEAQAHTLFELDRPGFVFFDDFDAAVRDRDPASQHQDQSTFLGGLDGLEVHHGVVYLFTSNARLADLNPAFRRPGRIDLVLAFSRPDADLRRKLIIRWHRDIISALQVDEVVAETEGLSYAEIEEVKKLLVLRQLDTGEWDWRWAWEVYRTGRGTGALRQRIGFTRNGHSERSASSRR